MPSFCGVRVNMLVYKHLSSGAMVCVAGRFHAVGVLTTTDAGLFTVELGRLQMLYVVPASFVEVVGKKITDDCMTAMGIVHLQSGEVDDEIWNEAITVGQIPALRDLFAPLEERSNWVNYGRQRSMTSKYCLILRSTGRGGDPGEGL